MIEDLEDSILLKGFKNIAGLDARIQKQLDEDRKEEFKLNPIYEQVQQTKDAGGKLDKNQSAEEKLKTPMEVGKEQDSKRNFLNDFRPCAQNKGKMHYWNFVEEENKTPHVLRSNAKPGLSYVDGRCETLLKLIENLSSQILSFNRPDWERLNKET